MGLCRFHTLVCGAKLHQKPFSINKSHGAGATGGISHVFQRYFTIKSQFYQSHLEQNYLFPSNQRTEAQQKKNHIVTAYSEKCCFGLNTVSVLTLIDAPVCFLLLLQTENTHRIGYYTSSEERGQHSSRLSATFHMSSVTLPSPLLWNKQSTAQSKGKQRRSKKRWWVTEKTQSLIGNTRRQHIVQESLFRCQTGWAARHSAVWNRLHVSSWWHVCHSWHLKI